MNIFEDDRTVMTLDAGGTNFEFSALRGGKEAITPIRLPAHAKERGRSLKTIIQGFKEVQNVLDEEPASVSFAFPGPADYPAGIINNVGNLPAYSGGVALGPMLEDQFDLPVFINNDGDLFAYGEAMAGLLPEVNQALSQKDIPKQYKNLFGVTVGTGFGGGMVIDHQLVRGDNSAAAEIWITRNFEEPQFLAEEGVSIRAIQHVYNENTPDNNADLSPKEIYGIAQGENEGNQQAAIFAFEKLGTALGEALANAITLFDGLMVIGGGISKAYDLFLPAVIKQLNSTIANREGKELPRLVSRVYSLEDTESRESFYGFENSEVSIPFSDKKISWTPEKKLAVGISRLGTGTAIALGAYAFALNNI